MMYDHFLEIGDCVQVENISNLITSSSPISIGNIKISSPILP